MEVPKSGTRSLLVGILLLLVTTLFVQIYALYLSVQERQQRQVVSEEILKAIGEIEKSRIEVFSDYVKDLESYETKSIYHQIYHVNNAQLKLQNLLVQENQMISMLIAGKSLISRIFPDL